MPLRALHDRIRASLARQASPVGEAPSDHIDVRTDDKPPVYDDVSHSTSWTTVAKSAMSLEDFSEYFVARVLREDLHDLATRHKDIDVNLVEGTELLDSPRIVHTQIGEFDVHIHLDNTGFCLPAPERFVSDIYVLFVTGSTDNHWKGYQKWLENVRKQKPFSPIIILQCHYVDGTWMEEPAPNQRDMPKACAKLATISMTGVMKSEPFRKVVSRCALLELLERRTLSESEVTIKGASRECSSIPSYIYESTQCLEEIPHELRKTTQTSNGDSVQSTHAELLGQPPSYDFVGAEAGSSTVNMNLHRSRMIDWVQKVKTSMSLEEFSEYFVETLVREPILLHDFNTITESLEVDLVCGTFTKHYPGIFDTQIGNRACHIHIDPSGFCLPRSRKPRFRVYVVFICHYSDIDRKVYLKWLQGARGLSPRCPIILYRCHETDGIEKPGPNPNVSDDFDESFSKLATIYMDGVSEDKDKIFKVITRCAMLMSMEDRVGHTSTFQNRLSYDSRANPVPEYTYKKMNAFYDC